MNQPITTVPNQAATPQNAQSFQAPAAQAQNSAMQGQADSRLGQIIQQVVELKTTLHEFVETESFNDAKMISASGVLEGHLNHYYQMAVEKENQKPGLQSF